MPVKDAETEILPAHQRRPTQSWQGNKAYHIKLVPKTRAVNMIWGRNQECIGLMSIFQSESSVGVKSWSLK